MDDPIGQAEDMEEIKEDDREACVTYRGKTIDIYKVNDNLENYPNTTRASIASPNKIIVSLL